ncbi:hypothetical protein SDC9_209692 [bioreactor metagenome]|uniref:Uncharacterized protein n=1 Tax=bioreactor metagenome TaxID=1076179 RepID=A0A645JEP8_9ZZZZ
MPRDAAPLAGEAHRGADCHNNVVFSVGGHHHRRIAGFINGLGIYPEIFRPSGATLFYVIEIVFHPRYLVPSLAKNSLINFL